MAAPEPTSQSRRQASISVIVPSHNCGPFIAEALDSILAQTLPVAQIIVVDDGSTDNTAQVLGRYSGPRIQHIRQERAGLASARNAGLDAARGEFITFLNADDRWSPAFVERMYDYLAEDPGIACVFSNFAHIEPATGKIVGDQFQHYPEIKRPVLLRDAPHAHGRIPKEKAFGALVTCSDIPAYLQVMMFRRSAIGQLRFDPRLEQGAATSFALKAFMSGMVVFTDEVLALVRRPDLQVAAERGDQAVHTLNGLKAIEADVTRERDVRPYQERLIKAHIDAGLAEARLGQTRAGLSRFRGAFRFPGSGLRKLQGTLRMLLAVPRGLMK